MGNKDSVLEIGHIVCLTHWDREWHVPLWTQRRWLVQMMDTLLDILDNQPDYSSFLLDGQSVLVDDYLEIRPENKERFVQHVRGGRIQIGPWYTLPDEFPVDGECLVRSLLLGSRISESYGGCMRLGLTTFGWGQTAQLPQIYAGFGVDTILIGKGINQLRVVDNEFLWEAPDGTALLTSRFGDFGRSNFYFNAMLPILFGQDYLNSWQFNWGDDRFPFHRADEQGYWQDYVSLDQLPVYDEDKLQKAIDAAWESTRNTKVKQHRFLGNGSDFTIPDPRIIKIIKDANKLDGNRKLVLSSLPEYVTALRENIETDKLQTVIGELRDGPPEATSANALAIRPHIKRRNRLAQNALIRIAEPFASIAQNLGIQYPKTFLDKAWHYLLLAQPHDSINGVTQDKTSDDVVNRLDQVLELADMVADQSIQEILRLIDLSRYTPQDILLVLFNPLPFARKEIIKVRVDTPSDWELIDFSMESDDEEQLLVQPLSREAVVVPVRDSRARPSPFSVDRHSLYLETGEIPACGYKVVRLVPGRKHARHAVYWPLPEERIGPTILREPNMLENEHLCVKVQTNGTLDILDKATNQWHLGLHTFEDSGDIGDYWVRRRPGHDQVVLSLGARARIWSKDNGTLAATLVTEVSVILPARADKEMDRRSLETKEILITSEITLRKNSRSVEIYTHFNNAVEDHRLRVFFPTDISAQYSNAEGHFGVDQRVIDPTEHAINDQWPEMWTYPQQSFVDISDDQSGIAVINDGICEYEVISTPRRTVALTLLRSVRNEICSEFRVSTKYPHEKGGQSLGYHEFRYSLYFHDGNWETGQVHRVSQSFNVPLRIVQTGSHQGMLPQQQSLFSLEPAALVLNTLKKAEDRESIILRLHNPTKRIVSGEITSAVPIRRSWLTNLNEERDEEIKLKETHHIQCEVPPSKILTIEIEL